MRKYIIGMIVGAAIATAGSAYAEDIKTLIGKQIQGEIPVKVNGETIEKKAIFVDGTSYLPVRAIGDALNYNVKYDADMGVELTPKEASRVEQTTETPVEPKQISEDDAFAIRTSEEQIELSKSKINELEQKIAELNKQIDSESNSDLKKIYTVNKETAEDILQGHKDNIVSQQAYIAKIKAKYE